jgi:ABC-2 type transport system ATP-binding protein
MPVINVIGLKKNFKGTEVIKGLNFQLEEGKCIALLGQNGAGKTTTLGMLAGLLSPSAGKILFSGEKKQGDFRGWIGYLPQFPVFYDWMTGKEFLEYVGKLSGLSHKESKVRTKELLELTGILEAQNRKISKYSGGMKQRLGIAQAIIHRPSLVMLDEPVSALDPLGRREVLDLLEKLKKETTVLFSTHILNDAEEVCDKILFLHKGEIVESGTMDSLRDKYQQSKIDITFRGKAEDYMNTFRCKDLIDSYHVEGSQVSILVHDIYKAKKALLVEIAEKNMPLLKFEISRMNLEDVFMKVVKS